MVFILLLLNLLNQNHKMALAFIHQIPIEKALYAQEKKNTNSV
jgi:hypothetical protein